MNANGASSGRADPERGSRAENRRSRSGSRRRVGPERRFPAGRAAARGSRGAPLHGIPFAYRRGQGSVETRTAPSNSTRPSRTRPLGGGSPLSGVRRTLRKERSHHRRRLTWGIVGAVLGTLVLTVLVLNLSSGERSIDHRVAHLYGVGDPQFSRSMGNLLGPPLLPGNAVVELVNGDADLPRHARGHPRRASRRITFETFIYWSGTIGEQFTQALLRAGARRRQGPRPARLGGKRAGSTTSISNGWSAPASQVERYHPLRWYTLARLNNRTHRKLLVVDGRVGFTGGVGIADEWLGNAQDQKHWRDTHFRLEGPAVAQMQAAFLDNWLKTQRRGAARRRLLPGAAPAPATSRPRSSRARPRDGSESARLMYLLSIAAARESILISRVLLRAGRADRRDAGRGAEARRRRADHPARARHRRRGLAQGVARRAGAPCSRPASRSTSTSRPCTTAR